MVEPNDGVANDPGPLCLFSTEIRRARHPDSPKLNAELRSCAEVAAVDDAAGQAWCRKHHFPGYTSYGSLDDLPWRFPAIATLKKWLDRQAKDFARAEMWDLAGGKIELDNIWINLLPPGGYHGSHIHPHAVISGTYYVAVPPGADAIRFEDPRLGLMMAAPARKPKAANQPFVTLTPEPGLMVMWESWLRHEVPANRGESDRISISFNYRWTKP